MEVQTVKKHMCDQCKKEFKQKSDYTKHKNKKTPCTNIEEIQKLNTIVEIKSDNKNLLINIFKSCLNILRDNEGLTGEKALRSLSYLLILKLIEPQFGKTIDIDNYNYDLSDMEESIIEHNKKRLLTIVRFSKLYEENINTYSSLMKHLWDYILSQHPSTKNIFMKGKGFDIQHNSTYKKIMDKLMTLPNTDVDILGNAYEEVIQDIMTGKVLGQFFTQPLIKKMMVKLIDPQIYPNGKIDTCGDPTMGTGGFLITYLQYILDQAKSRNIKPDWDFIKNEGLYGKEIDPDTYQLAVSNMLISSGHMFNALDRGDSIREPIIRKFDNILANPPFGIKGLKYNDFTNILKNEYIPIKSDNAVSLFIQAIIYMLKINGKCAIVLPDGQDLFSKTNDILIAVREYLMKTCDLKEIIYLPSGIFTYTSIKTCVFYFIKKKEGTDILQLNIKMSKTNKENGRDYSFSKTVQTSTVKFYDYNPYEDVKNLLVEVPIEKIVNNSYSLNYAEYMKDIEELYGEDVILKTLGEVCTIVNGEKKRSKEGKDKGLYPLYYCSILGNLYLDTFDYTDEGIIVNKINGQGKAMVYYGYGKYNVGETTIHFKSNNNEVLTKYIYYYLFHNIELLQKYYKGANQKIIIESDLFNIKIPIPTIVKQKEIIKYLDFIYEKANKTSNEKINELKILNGYCVNAQKIFCKNDVITLNEMCNFLVKSKRQASYGSTQGKYPFFKSSNTVNSYVDSPDYNDESIIIGNGGEPNINYGINFSTSDHCHVLQSKNKQLYDMKYIYYYVYNNFDMMEQLYTGLTIKNITKSNIEQIKIHIPSFDKQKEIVKYCEKNDLLIEHLTFDIINNKSLAKQFINNIITLDESINDNNNE